MAVVLLASCGTDGGSSTAESSDTAPRPAVESSTPSDPVRSRGKGEAEFPSFRSLDELSSAASALISAEPVDDSPPQLVGTIAHSENVTDEYYGKRFSVTNVLSGAGLEPGDVVQVTWLAPVVSIQDTETGEVAEIQSGGEGYATDLSGPLYIFALSRPLDFVEGDNAWGVVASAHGVVAFERGQDGTYVVAPPKSGQDGSLQSVLQGQRADELGARTEG